MRRGSRPGAGAAVWLLLGTADAINPYRLQGMSEPCQSTAKPYADVCYPTRCEHLFAVDHGGRLSPEPLSGYPQVHDAFTCNVSQFAEYPDGGGRDCLRPTCHCRYGYSGGSCHPAVRNGCIRHSCVREPVGAESNPGVDCADIRARRATAERIAGSFWVGNDTTKEEVYCDLSSLGRAWRLVMRDSSVLAMNITNVLSASATAFGTPHGGVYDRFKDCADRCNVSSGAVLFKTTFVAGSGPAAAASADLPSGFLVEAAAVWFGSLADLGGANDDSCDTNTKAWAGGTSSSACTLSNELTLLVRNSTCGDPGDQGCFGWTQRVPTVDWFGWRDPADMENVVTQNFTTELLWIESENILTSLKRAGADPAILRREVYVWVPPD
eukprot:TRINITY_DN35928_c0_g1_i1.p1 TRINITY_DN35928_c0_g1~~TRINITY_DN35928_c0_g1_i1.p1  ORF type:complete len:396 (+),score=83.88 TRINITY_DN35928_c0_g1_i1:45-1190(+)